VAAGNEISALALQQAAASMAGGNQPIIIANCIYIYILICMYRGTGRWRRGICGTMQPALHAHSLGLISRVAWAGWPGLAEDRLYVCGREAM